MRIYSLFVLLIGITGCAALNQPISEMPASYLTCTSNPEFVDGNLETESTFAVNGFVRKAYHLNQGEGRRLAYAQRRYLTVVEGQRRTEAIHQTRCADLCLLRGSLSGIAADSEFRHDDNNRRSTPL